MWESNVECGETWGYVLLLPRHAYALTSLCALACVSSLLTCTACNGVHPREMAFSHGSAILPHSCPFCALSRFLQLSFPTRMWMRMQTQTRARIPMQLPKPRPPGCEGWGDDPYRRGRGWHLLAFPQKIHSTSSVSESHSLLNYSPHGPFYSFCHPLLVHITGFETRAGTRVRVRVWCEASARNPYPRDGFFRHHLHSRQYDRHILSSLVGPPLYPLSLPCRV